ncbi:penicillin-binding transpeptidase domain-containing protein [Lederbergia lenta]|uniref:serine-type D-Ala-D-Ala carboxypeptidase n=1 Tax=Lederbergia lenta TaxID=1467 RepID=A0A2X4W8H6_LEDLE|nr:penicillin-binding transpeptidase domain-containing protein [Lederbergia lenta]MCM3110243.1 penicillin-binding transpeptidase domain-containing protein [Lederbergia lenta]MEC2324189.1 penicillin-binding transpeptidase domain-containing protein [Lederbergia lenta]SQI60506.1 penicillin-binding protein transpeptidase [Lederbergia lenta]
MTHSKKNRNKGAAFLFIIFGVLFFVLIVRFITIQYTGEAEGKVLAAKAAQTYLRKDVIKSKRGTIYDRKGEVIAEDSASYTLVAILDEKLTTDPEHPNHVVDLEKTAAELAKNIEMEESEIYSRLAKEGRKQVEFGRAGRDLPHNIKKKIEALKLPGISFMKDSKRFYPNGIFASHLIGYAQKNQEDSAVTEITGQTGLEKTYDKLLKGKDGSLQYEGDIWNYILPNSKKQVVEPENGSDIYLTIDKKIQTFLEEAMNKVDEEYKPKRIMAMVADPKTGKILAMGQRPTYHPATREGIDQSWHNEIIETSFEPGSTMKIFSLAAAVEEKKFNPNEQFKSGTYQVDKKSQPIRDHNSGRGWGTIPYLEGVQRSSNVAFAYLLEKIGTEKWREYMDNFKFGTKTGIALPNEVAGNILYDWPIEKVTSVYGQGTTVTAVQMVQAMSAIANDGKMMKPYVVDKIVNPNDGTIKESKPEKAGQPISKETAKEVRKILETTLLPPDGTAQNFQLEGYRVAGKTGTAQIPNPNGGGYLEGQNNYIFSFLGTAPADDPKLVVYVAVEQPQLKINENGVENGSVPVSKIFNPVMKNSLQYLNIEPEKIPEAKIFSLPDFSSMNKKEMNKVLKDNGLVPVIVGKGEKIIGQSPAKSTEVFAGEKVMIRFNGDKTIPNMAGWSKRDVLKIAQLLDVKVNMTGEGFVFKQNLKPGSIMKQDDQLVVSFETPTQKLEREKKQKLENNENPPLD